MNNMDTEHITVIDMEEGNEKIQQDTMLLFHRFCWPGFIMPQIWGLGNGQVLGLVALMMPFIAPIISIYFGMHGYRLAYERFPTYKTIFYEKQVKWRKASIIYITVVPILIFAFAGESLINYFTNKHEIRRIVSEFEDKRDNLVAGIERLMSEEYLDQYIGERDYIVIEDMDVNDDGQLWDLQNSYEFDDLCQKLYVFDEPKVVNIDRSFDIENGKRIWVYFDITGDFKIKEANYYIFSEEEVYKMTEGNGVYLDSERWQTYMNVDTMNQLLGKY